MAALTLVRVIWQPKGLSMGLSAVIETGLALLTGFFGLKLLGKQLE